VGGQQRLPLQHMPLHGTALSASGGQTKRTDWDWELDRPGGAADVIMGTALFFPTVPPGSAVG
jgi:hypothetical protein